jgi:carboxymethylenebutenolidase
MKRMLFRSSPVIAASLLILGAAPVPAPDIHAEWVKYANRAGDSIAAYLAYPERPDPAPAMIVIHEIFGLSEWIREVTEDLAQAGYVAIAPDLLSRRGGTGAQEDPRRAISGLPADSITVDLDGAFEYLRSRKAVRGDAIGVIGFCWGGGQSFRYATDNRRLKAAVVCYGPAPDLATVGRIAAPVFGVYAENDARINANLPEVERAMREAGKTFRHTIYPGTGHGFLRTRNEPSQAERAWGDILAFLRERLGG